MCIVYLQHFLFACMIIIYLYVIRNVYHYYTKNDSSISSIIKNKECNEIVFINMCAMGVVTLVYELLRCDVCSFFSIVFILVGIYGVVLYDHTMDIHYVYCFIVFISILLFMYNHCCKIKDIILYSSLCVQGVLCSLIFMETNILNCEIYLLANFAFFYIYLHFTQVCRLETLLWSEPAKSITEPPRDTMHIVCNQHGE
jgi:hypothetical protein